jgi:hypothetical protein
VNRAEIEEKLKSLVIYLYTIDGVFIATLGLISLLDPAHALSNLLFLYQIAFCFLVTLSMIVGLSYLISILDKEEN